MYPTVKFALVTPKSTNMLIGWTSKWFILIEGVASIIIAVSAFWFIPKWPHNTGTYYLTAEESAMAQFRMQVSNGGISEDDEGGRWAGIVMAAKDPFTWMFTVLHFFVIMAQSFKDFFPSVSMKPPSDADTLPNTYRSWPPLDLAQRKHICYKLHPT
jgi:hypothetical protein